MASELPIACSLSAGELADRRRGLLAELASLVVEWKRLDDGLELVLPGTEGAIGVVSRLLAAERECCRFLRFRLELEPDLGPLTLVISGPPGTAAAVEALFGFGSG